MEPKIKQLENQLEKLSNNSYRAFYPADFVEAWVEGTVLIDPKGLRGLKKINSKMQCNFDDGACFYDKEYVDRIGSEIIQNYIEVCKREKASSAVMKKHEPIKITMTQSNSYIQTISIDVVMSVMKNELKESQLLELNNILHSSIEKDEKKDKLSAKLKEFGISTLSGILSGVLSNMIKS